MKTLSIETCLLSLTGLEDIIDIPGTVGGGIIMNASYGGNGMYDVLLKVKVITPNGNTIKSFHIIVMNGLKIIFINQVNYFYDKFDLFENIKYNCLPYILSFTVLWN